MGSLTKAAEEGVRGGGLVRRGGHLRQRRPPRASDGLAPHPPPVPQRDIPLAENAPGGMVEFRSSLTLSFFFKFFLHVMHEMNIKGLWKVGLDAANMSAIQSYTRPVSIGTQGYESVGQGTAVGQSMVHMSAMLQKAHATFCLLGDSVAKCSPGFAGLFLSKMCLIIGIVVADTHDSIKAAANKVNIEYSELPAILSIAKLSKPVAFIPIPRDAFEWGCSPKHQISNICCCGICSFLLSKKASKDCFGQDVDMMTTGQRHSFLGKYKRIGFITWLQNSAESEEIKELNFQSEELRFIMASCSVVYNAFGIAIVPKFGISFTAKFMNQVAQVAASSLDIPLSCVFISETSTDKVPNASPTAASASSDLYGAAVLDACQQIKARFVPIGRRGDHMYIFLLMGLYHPDIGFDWIAGKGSPFNYFTYGAAFAEVEIDTLTGDFHTRTADIVMDLGYSINPAIDIGQIEGAFIQGLGWAAMEELKWGDDNHKWIRPGHLFTCGPGSYKIPSINDIPLNFKVSLLKGVPNPRAIHSSKAVGEPPFFLASAVLFAIKALIAAD
ncbi:hypothetical protein ZWY2020_042504 [Hordeum vulgare]|nr:hypothetical protein ZWY2020_042504 [Hordeum vulgare]